MGMRNQCIDQARFAHAGLPGQYGAFTQEPLQERLLGRWQTAVTGFGFECDDLVASRFEHLQANPRFHCAGQIGFVECDQRRHTGRMRDQQDARNELFRCPRLHCGQYQDLIDVGGD